MRVWPLIAAHASSAAVAAIRPPMSRRCGAASTPTKPARGRTWRRSSRRSVPSSRRPRRRPAPAGRAGGNGREHQGQAARLEPSRSSAIRSSRKTISVVERRALAPACCARRPAGLRRRRRERRRAARPFPGPSGGGKTHRSLAHPAEGADRGWRSEDRRTRRARSFDAVDGGGAHRLRAAGGGRNRPSSARTSSSPSSTRTSI